MAILTTVHNPFDPLICREVKEIEAGKPIYAVIDGFYCHFDVVVSLNGMITHDYEYIIKEDDHIGFVAVLGKGGGKALMTVAAIALAVATAGASSAASASMIAAGYGTTAAAVGGAMAAMAVGIAGGMLINALLPTSMPSVGAVDNISSSPTYGWDNAKNQINEGTPLPIIYGKTKIVPPVISMYVESKDNKQYLNVLYALNDGEITSVSDIMINDNPISFYNNVSYSVRLGTNNQTLIPSFDNTRVDTSVGAKFSTAETIRRTSYNNVSGLSIVVSAPGGLYYANNSGGLDQVNVDLQIKYRKVGNPDWISLTQYTPIYSTELVYDSNIDDYVEQEILSGYKSSTSISGASTSTIRATYSINDIPSGQYEVNIKRTSAESTSSRSQNKVYWESFTEIIYDDFVYPNTALLSITALATDQLSGSMPTISCIVDRGVGTSNPATAAQNILSLEGADINVTAFSEWATWCNTQGFKCNLVFDSEMNVRDALNMVGLLGRANVIQVGSEYIPIIDRAETLSTQRFLFTMGNIIRDSFKEEYLPLADRSNIIEVTYFDETLEYDRQSIEIYQHGYDEATDTARKASVTLYGCTSRAQAIRHARFMMNKNRYLTNTVSFEADVDAIACTIGDIINVSHDVPQWGYSGRFLNVGIVDANHWAYTSATTINGATATDANTIIVQLDRELSIMASVEYGLTIRLHDDTIASVLIVPSTSLLTDTIIVPIIDIQKFDLYAFGEINRVSKLFRVVSISRSSDQRRRISAIEYIPEVYDDQIDQITVQNISSLAEVSYLNVTVDEELLSSGQSINVITLMWAGQAISWDIYSNNDFVANTKNNWYQIRDVPAGEYTYKVGAISRIITVEVAKYPLADVLNFNSYFNGADTVFGWDSVFDIRKPVEYEIRQGSSWDNGQVCGATSSNSFRPPIAGSYWIKARYYDPYINDYIYSENAEGVSISELNLVKNYIAQINEATTWGGLLEGMAIYDGVIELHGVKNVTAWESVLNLQSIKYAGGVIQSGTYTVPDEHIVDINVSQMCFVTASIDAIGFNPFDMVSSWVSMSDLASIIGNTGSQWNVSPQICVAGDDAIFGDWKSFIPGDYYGRMFKMRLLVNSYNSDIAVKINAFNWSIDVPDRIEKGTAVTVGIDGISVIYSRVFFGSPNTQITIIDAQEGDYYELSNQTLEGFELKTKNGTSNVVRSVNWISQSY